MDQGSFRLTEEQRSALSQIREFSSDPGKDVFVLRGSAGTGKTTLIGEIVTLLRDLHLSVSVNAPTGRAARILGSKLDYPASTIHRTIYNLTDVTVNEDAESANDPGVRFTYPLKEDEPDHTVFIIDEASMVGDMETRNDFMQFGTGRLLHDIIQFLRMNRPGRAHDLPIKLIFVGDPAQLAPVGENSSPALSPNYLVENYNLSVDSFELKTVMRQEQGSAILTRATVLRDSILANCFTTFSLASDQKNILHTDATGAIEKILDGVKERRSVVAIVPTNAMAVEYNRSVRTRLWGTSSKPIPIQLGDTLLINKNSPTNGMNNGDLAKVTKVADAPEIEHVALKGEYAVELSFRDVTVAFRNGQNEVIEISCFVLENLLDSPSRELSALEQRALLVHFRKRYPHLKPKTAEFRKTIATDPYFNALQVKFGYAMTCHKAQGGEWSMAIVDFGANGNARNESFFRWAYTAITRASQQLVLINAPEFNQVSSMDWGLSEATDQQSTRVEISGMSSDPDWDSFAFRRGMEDLFGFHKQIRDAWYSEGIEIEQLQHLQYCERYRLKRGEHYAVLQYYFNAKNKIGRIELVTNATLDVELGDLAIALAREQAEKRRSASQPRAEEFISDFLDNLKSALSGTAINVVASEPMQYRLRVTFSDEVHRGQIDFIYDKKSVWTSAVEVGGPGSTRGLYEEVRRRFMEEQGTFT